MILILSNHEDLHVQEVTKYLPQHSYLILDLSQIPKQQHIAISYQNEFKAVLLDEHGNILTDLTQYKSFWWRRPQLYNLHEEIKSTEFINWTYQELEETIFGLWQSLEGNWLNDPNYDDYASRKVYQLRVARNIGFLIPATIITNSKHALDNYRATQMTKNIIFKPFHGNEQHWRETRILSTEDEQQIENLKFSPVIFQDYIEATVDLRITVVDGKIFPAEIHSQTSKYKVDFRMDMKNVTVKAHKLPKEIRLKILELMKRLNLVYGAIDMRLTPNGDYVFLEINPAGQWLFIESETKQPIAKAIADYLLKGYDAPENEAVPPIWNIQS
ncbi:ATP-grasp ribosomal peptide maturase [Flavobacteriaceae bacterium MHTCC 0001]